MGHPYALNAGEQRLLLALITGAGALSGQVVWREWRHGAAWVTLGLALACAYMGGRFIVGLLLWLPRQPSPRFDGLPMMLMPAAGPHPARPRARPGVRRPRRKR